MKLNADYFQHDNVLELAEDLIGKELFTLKEDVLTGGIIVETEAYAGVTDKASHAYGGRRTDRTRIMYQAGGIAYVYLCYGIHNLFNVITNVQDVPHAILIRAIEPTEGVDAMLNRRKMKEFESRISSGPGSMSQALGIERNDNGLSLAGDTIWIEDKEIKPKVVASARVGIKYAEDHAKLPWRFYAEGNVFVSKPLNPRY